MRPPLRAWQRGDPERGIQTVYHALGERFSRCAGDRAGAIQRHAMRRHVVTGEKARGQAAEQATAAKIGTDHVARATRAPGH